MGDSLHLALPRCLLFVGQGSFSPPGGLKPLLQSREWHVLVGHLVAALRLLVNHIVVHVHLVRAGWYRCRGSRLVGLERHFCCGLVVDVCYTDSIKNIISVILEGQARAVFLGKRRNHLPVAGCPN